MANAEMTVKVSQSENVKVFEWLAAQKNGLFLIEVNNYHITRVSAIDRGITANELLERAEKMADGT